MFSPTGTICHGDATLLASISTPDSGFPVEGKAPGAHVIFGADLQDLWTITVLSNGEEAVQSAFDQLVDCSQGR